MKRPAHDCSLEVGCGHAGYGGTSGGGPPSLHTPGAVPSTRTTLALWVTKVRYNKQHQTTIERIADSIAHLHTEISDVKTCMYECVESEERDVNMDEELTLLK